MSEACVRRELEQSKGDGRMERKEYKWIRNFKWSCVL